MPFFSSRAHSWPLFCGEKTWNGHIGSNLKTQKDVVVIIIMCMHKMRVTPEITFYYCVHKFSLPKWRKTKGIIAMIRSRHMSADNSWLLAADRSEITSTTKAFSIDQDDHSYSPLPYLETTSACCDNFSSTNIDLSSPSSRSADHETSSTVSHNGSVCHTLRLWLRPIAHYSHWFRSSFLPLPVDFLSLYMMCTRRTVRMVLLDAHRIDRDDVEGRV